MSPIRRVACEQGEGIQKPAGKVLGDSLLTLAVTCAFLFIPHESQCPDLEVLTKYFKVHLLQFQEFSIREHTSSQLPIPLLGPRVKMLQLAAICHMLVTSTWEPAWGDMSRCFFVPWGIWPPCFLSTFHSLPSDSLLLQPRGQAWRGCLNHTHIQQTL